MQVQMQVPETLFTGVEFMCLPSDFTDVHELVDGRPVPLPVTSMTHDIYTVRIASALHQMESRPDVEWDLVDI